MSMVSFLSIILSFCFIIYCTVLFFRDLKSGQNSIVKKIGCWLKNIIDVLFGVGCWLKNIIDVLFGVG